MTVTLATTNISPLIFSPGQQIIAADILAAARMLNWVQANRPTTHVALSTGDAGDGITVGSTRIIVGNSSGSWVNRLRFKIKVCPDVAQLLTRYTFTVDTNDGSSMKSRLTVGAAIAVTTTHGFGTTTTDVPINTSDSGTGLILVTLELYRDVGTSNASLDTFTLQDAILSSLPDPVD